jgi:hypothetical protein
MYFAGEVRTVATVIAKQDGDSSCGGLYIELRR